MAHHVLISDEAWQILLAHQRIAGVNLTEEQITKEMDELFAGCGGVWWFPADDRIHPVIHELKMRTD